jgi:hypothetical protein
MYLDTPGRRAEFTYSNAGRSTEPAEANDKDEWWSVSDENGLEFIATTNSADCPYITYPGLR